MKEPHPTTAPAQPNGEPAEQPAEPKGVRSSPSSSLLPANAAHSDAEPEASVVIELEVEGKASDLGLDFGE